MSAISVGEIYPRPRSGRQGIVSLLFYSLVDDLAMIGLEIGYF
jgi:hypothetical protein